MQSFGKPRGANKKRSARTKELVIASASEAIQRGLGWLRRPTGLLRRFAPRNDGVVIASASEAIQGGLRRTGRPYWIASSLRSSQ